jgi:hypothetical protein
MRILLAGLIAGVSLAALAAAPLTESTFTEIIQDVNVVTAADKTVAPARTNAVFKAPDLVRTGPDSRVEMTAPDQTITRIGANTVFTFEPGGRDIQLEKGSLLFHSPAGKGGGTIKYRGTAAAVLGTTMLCAVLPDGSFKTLVLEGQGKVTLASGRSITLNAGQMVIVRADGNDFGPAETFNLQKLVGRLLLVVGFSHPLSSQPLIVAAIQLQIEQLAAGKLDHVVSTQTAGIGLDLTGGHPELPPPPQPYIHDNTLAPVSPTQPSP